ncbi:MAG TPA: Gfo/Idh/MocA family oxidoreductase [Bryobacteraceae bacterium]|nr:Gfo/Idh/MocA family oxidoreductase [Bryobacteraceae bacterium]
MRPTLLAIAVAAFSLPGFAADLRLGIIGVDTSHAIEFTRILNDSSAREHVEGARVVAAFAGGSPDIPSSRDRVAPHVEELKGKYQIRFVDEIQDLCPLVDGILLESVDGRPHLAQFREASACGKPVFIDKPLASTLADAKEIARIGAEKHIPWFSTSSLRYSEILNMRSPDLQGAFVWGPGPMEEHHQLDLTWYGIHPVEMLFTLMGPDVIEVTRTYSQGADVITGRWGGGRLGTVRTGRPYSSFGAVTFLPDNKSNVQASFKVDYAPMLAQVVEFMKTGTPPVPNNVTLKIFEFMDAAQRSRENGGKPEPVQ